MRGWSLLGGRVFGQAQFGGGQESFEGWRVEDLFDLLDEAPGNRFDQVDVDVLGVALAPEEIAEVGTALQDIARLVEAGPENGEERDMEVLDRLCFRKFREFRLQVNGIYCHKIGIQRRKHRPRPTRDQSQVRGECARRESNSRPPA